MTTKDKPVKIAFVLSAKDARVLEWQRQRLREHWRAMRHLKEPSLVDAVRTLIYNAVAILDQTGQLDAEVFDEVETEDDTAKIDP
jgi:hypothetical protein